METRQFKDRKDTITERADYIAEEEFVQRHIALYKQSDRYKEYMKRRQAEQDVSEPQPEGCENNVPSPSGRGLG
jgi:hypothetical protein